MKCIVLLKVSLSLANFKTHVVTAAAASGILASSLLAIDHVTPVQATLLFSLGTVGGCLPDLDSDRSTPLTIGFNILAVLLAFFVMFSQSARYSIIEMLIVWISVYAGVKFIALRLFQKMTVHRGLFHSVPAALLGGLLTTIAYDQFFNFGPHMAWLCGFFITWGYLIHLILDEMFSVNLLGLQIKRSFGTALKLLDTKNLYNSALLYLGIYAATWVTPRADAVIDTYFSRAFYDDLMGAWLPKGAWFAGLL